jgi:hypothetical protein
MAFLEDDDEFFGSQEDENVLGREEDMHTGSNDSSLSSSKWGEIGFGALPERERLAKQSDLETVAFLDTFDEYKESKLQEGFEFGVTETYDTARRIGKLLGKATTVQLLQEKSTGNVHKITNMADIESVKDVTKKFFSEEFQTESSIGCKQSLEGLEKTLQLLLSQSVDGESIEIFEKTLEHQE